MSQHFLLTAASRTLSLKAIYKAGETAAYDTFKSLRWASTNGEPVCPVCGCVECKPVKGRITFRCTGCAKQFSVTSGTLFHGRKLSYVDLMAAICLFINGAKGMSAVQFSRDMDVQYKTAFVLCHKLREAMASEVAGHTLDGEVEIDGAYFGGIIRPANRKENRVDRRKAENQTGTRRVVIALRQRQGRTLTLVRKSEAEGVELAETFAPKATTFYADEAAHWDALHSSFKTLRINHSEAYSEFNGLHTNGVESFFSRLRRMVDGQHHGVSPKYLYQYASHAGWLEDHRRRANGDNTKAIVSNSVHSPSSLVWSGYWQRTSA
jgi:transposase-like protein